ncbi:MAG: hypothetical protein BroJett012_18870 [Betaproteobacteria bacterium]|nr:MAG: hypothetical protein BroJett012_18870 [Betaproteobacteria bacterium]
MPRKPINTPPTIAQVTAEREAKNAANKAEVDALMDRDNRNVQLRADPEWQRNRAANYPVDERN